MESGVSIFEVLDLNEIDPASIEIQVADSSRIGSWLGLLLNFLPLLVFIGLIWALLRKVNSISRQ